jgi:hypothetical protein
MGGIDYSVVSQAKKRFQKRMKENPEVRKKCELFQQFRNSIQQVYL